MRLFEVPRSDSNTLNVELPQLHMHIDPRVLEFDHNGWTFDCVIRETTLTIVRTDKPEKGWDCDLYFRLYDTQVEEMPDITPGGTYIYHGLVGEYAPCDCMQVIVHPSVTEINGDAFCGCKKITKCIMDDGVITIGQGAFSHCEAMKVLRLSRNLQHIAAEAFASCKSMDGFFLPSSTVVEVDGGAFLDCTNMRILLLPPTIDLDFVGHRIVGGCTSLLTGGVQYWYADEVHDEQVNHWVKHRLDHLPLHKLCMDASVTSDNITDFVQEHGGGGTGAALETDEHGLTPLHLLTINPHATLPTIMVCFDANPIAALCQDDRGCTPLDYLWEYDNMEGMFSVIQALCMNWEMCRDVNIGRRKRKRECCHKPTLT